MAIRRIPADRMPSLNRTITLDSSPRRSFAQLLDYMLGQGFEFIGLDLIRCRMEMDWQCANFLRG